MAVRVLGFVSLCSFDHERSYIGWALNEGAIVRQALYLRCSEWDERFANWVDTQIEALQCKGPDQNKVTGASAKNDGWGHFLSDKNLR